MVVGMLRIPLAPNRQAQVFEVLHSIQGPVLAQPGCRAYHIYEEPGPEPAVVLVERWESKDALEAHIRSEFYRRILGAIELAGGPPEVSFDVVSTSEGMELIERLRKLDGEPPSGSGTELERPPGSQVRILGTTRSKRK